MGDRNGREFICGPQLGRVANREAYLSTLPGRWHCPSNVRPTPFSGHSPFLRQSPRPVAPSPPLQCMVLWRHPPPGSSFSTSPSPTHRRSSSGGMSTRAPIERGPRSYARCAFSPSLPPPNVRPPSNSGENQTMPSQCAARAHHPTDPTDLPASALRPSWALCQYRFSDPGTLRGPSGHFHHRRQLVSPPSQAPPSYPAALSPKLIFSRPQHP